MRRCLEPKTGRCIKFSFAHLVEIGVRRLDDLVVEMLFELEGIEALEEELEDGAEVLRRGRGHKDVRVAMHET